MIAALDTAMMQRCIRLSAAAAAKGEFPFAALICEGERVVVETTNLVVTEADVTRHAELVAISEAQKILGRKDLSACTLYSNVEPCVMCAFPIRETRIGRVVFAIGSPLMGGFSKWNVLRDNEISNVMPEAFGAVPEIIAGLCQSEAEKVWWKWNPIAWAVIKRRGCFGRAAATDGCEHFPPAPARLGIFRRLMMIHSNRRAAPAAAPNRNLGY
jgi:tRNA(adenine34) deaminase